MSIYAARSHRHQDNSDLDLSTATKKLTSPTWDRPVVFEAYTLQQAVLKEDEELLDGVLKVVDVGCRGMASANGSPLCGL